MPSRRDPQTGLCLRGTSNRNDRGSAEQRRRRKAWLISTYRANRDLLLIPPGAPHPPGMAFRDWGSQVYRTALEGTTVDVPLGAGAPATRCFRCGDLLSMETLTVDRIIPGCEGGTYRRNNIRPACGSCNSETGGPLARSQTPAKARAKKEKVA